MQSNIHAEIFIYVYMIEGSGNAFSVCLCAVPAKAGICHKTEEDKNKGLFVRVFDHFTF